MKQFTNLHKREQSRRRVGKLCFPEMQEGQNRDVSSGTRYRRLPGSPPFSVLFKGQSRLLSQDMDFNVVTLA